MHIPFCSRRCNYCDFFSTTRLNDQKRYAEAVCREIDIRDNFLKNKKIRTLYFGGGTPSLLSSESLDKIFGKLYLTFDFSSIEETTIECNPDDINKGFLNNIESLPINRLSIGIQSFDDDELRMTGRRHDAEQARSAVNEARKRGYSNISIDLMYGLPSQSIETWKKNIDEALKLDVTHISAYHLSYEDGTPICKLRNNAVSEETSLEMYRILVERLKDAGYAHYEISNFARNGFESKHNSTYWKQKEYLGLGAGAHSYNGRERCWNVSDLDRYMANPFPEEKEILTDDDIYNELLLTALRTSEGLAYENIDDKYRKHFIETAEKLIDSKYLTRKDNIYKLTEESIFMSDYVIRELMI